MGTGLNSAVTETIVVPQRLHFSYFVVARFESRGVVHFIRFTLVVSSGRATTRPSFRSPFQLAPGKNVEPFVRRAVPDVLRY